MNQTLKVPGMVLTLIAFFAYCATEATCFLWTPSYFAEMKPGLSKETVASFGSLIFGGGLMFGRLIPGFVSDSLGDKTLIRIGVLLEMTGIILVILPLSVYIPAAVGFMIIGTGMGPVYPAIQHMAPDKFGRKYSAAVIGLQMAAACTGSTLMPMVFGHLQQHNGMGDHAVLPFGVCSPEYQPAGVIRYCQKVLVKVTCFNSLFSELSGTRGNQDNHL